jgi:hypothetical protein
MNCPIAQIFKEFGATRAIVAGGYIDLIKNNSNICLYGKDKERILKFTRMWDALSLEGRENFARSFKPITIKLEEEYDISNFLRRRSTKKK